MILIIFAHPYPNRSNANKPLLDKVSELDQVVVSDLYEKYPDFHIAVKREQKLLRKAKIIIFQFPIYWYNVPAILKHWQEQVLTRGFAFGKTPQERLLQDKPCMAVVTTGHKHRSYQKGGYDCHKLEDFLVPLEQMADHCKMHYHPPLALYQAHRASANDLAQHALLYQQRVLELYQQVDG